MVAHSSIEYKMMKNKNIFGTQLFIIDTLLITNCYQCKITIHIKTNIKLILHLYIKK